MTKSTEFDYHKGYVLGIIFTACAGSFYFGYQAGVLAVFAGNFTSLGIEIQNEEAGILVSILPFAAAFGAILAGPLATRGRRLALIKTDIIGIIGPLIENLPGFVSFLIGRAICGVCVGLNSSLVPLFISEIAPIRVKGTLGTLNQISIVTGLIFGYVVGIGPYQTVSYWWRIMMLIPAGLACLRTLLLLIIFKFDTPTSSMLNGDSESAKKILEKIYPTGQVEKEMERVESEVIGQSLKKVGQIGYSDLFSWKLRKQFSIGCGLSALQQLSGINAICYSASEVLGGNQIANCMIGVCQMIGGLISAYVMIYFGRKSILFYGTLGCCILLFLFSFAVAADMALFKMIFLFSYIIVFGISLGPIVWLYIPEILPDKGVSLSTMINWTFTGIVVQAFSLTVKFGLVLNFTVFGVFCILGSVMIKLSVVETKGMSKFEIDMAYLSGNQEKINMINSLTPILETVSA